MTTSNVATMADRTMLVSMSRHIAGFSKKDKTATAQLLAANNARKGAAVVTKSVLEGCPQLKACQDQYNLLHREHVRMTKPFNDTPLRVLFSTMFPEYNTIMTGHISTYYSLADTFSASYQFEKHEAEHVQGDLYKESDYPAVDVIRAKFSVDLEYYPMPRADHWALDISNDITDELTTQFKINMQKAEATIYKDIYGDVFTRLGNMSKQMGEYDKKLSSESKRRPAIYDSLVTHIIDIADVMQKCNPNGDPEMDRMRIEILNAMRGVTTEGLHASQDLRTRTKVAVDDILAGLPSF